MENGILQINLLGTSFAIKTDEDPEYTNKLLNYYKKVVEGVEKKGVFRDSLQISIMAGLLMCDQVYQDKMTKMKIQEAYKNDTADSEADKIMQNLIEKLDKVL